MEPRMMLIIKIPDVRGSVITGRRIGRQEIKRAIKEALYKARFNGYPLFLSVQRKSITVK